MDGLIAYALAKKYTDKVGQDIISAGFKVWVEDDRSILNRQGTEKVLYLLPKESGSDQDGYDEFVYANNTWEWVGKTDVNLDYESLENKPVISANNIWSSEHPRWVLSNTLNFYYGDFYGNQYDDGEIIIHISSLFPKFHSEPLNYDFNAIGITTPFNGTIVVNKDIHVIISNFPAALSKIDRSNTFFIYQAFNSNYTSNSERPMLRKVYGYSTSGDYLEYAQICYVDYYYNGNTGRIISQTDWVELTGGGAQIVSAVVNANGMITFTDSNGNSFTTSGSNLVTSGNEQISIGYDDGGFYFLFDDGQEVTNNGTD